MKEVKFKSRRWIDIQDPSEADLSLLKKRYGFHELDLEDCLQESQRPKIDDYEKYLFIILHFPIYGKKQGRLDTGQLNIFVGHSYIITLHREPIPFLAKILEECEKSMKKRKAHLGQSTGHVLYQIVDALFSSVFPLTDKIQLSLRRIEEGIFSPKHQADQLLDIMVLKKDIITLRKIILPQRSVVAALEHKQRRFMPEDLMVYFEDVADQIERLWGILETEKEIIESLEDTNESLLSHKINSTIRTLTVFSAIMLPLTFLTGLFGMNVRLPFEHALESGIHFWAIVLSTILLVAFLVTLFKWKKWL